MDLDAVLFVRVYDVVRELVARVVPDGDAAVAVEGDLVAAHLHIGLLVSDDAKHSVGEDRVARESAGVLNGLDKVVLFLASVAMRGRVRNANAVDTRVAHRRVGDGDIARLVEGHNAHVAVVDDARGYVGLAAGGDRDAGAHLVVASVVHLAFVHRERRVVHDHDAGLVGAEYARAPHAQRRVRRGAYARHGDGATVAEVALVDEQAARVLDADRVHAVLGGEAQVGENAATRLAEDHAHAEDGRSADERLTAHADHDQASGAHLIQELHLTVVNHKHMACRHVLGFVLPVGHVGLVVDDGERGAREVGEVEG